MTDLNRFRRSRAKLAGVGALVIAGLLATATPAAASVSATPMVTPNVTGTVYAVAHLGGRTIIAGDFTAVGGVPRRNVAAILPNGTLDPTFAPQPNGVVNAVGITADGTRAFLGGEFTAVDGVPKADLAALDAVTGAVISDWTADSDGTVHAITVRANRVYVGGTFTTLDGVARRRLAWVDATTSAVDLAFNPWPNWTVKAVTVSPDGTKVYAAGGFTAIGSASRPGAAELLASTGRATAFAPTDGGTAIAVALSPDGRRFFFSTTNNRLWAYDPAVSNSPVYVIQTSGDTQAIAASATEVYFGGHFSQVQTHRAKRSLVASVYLADGAMTAWNPSLNGYMGVWAITTTPTSVILGGDFTKVGGRTRQGVAIFTGTP